MALQQILLPSSVIALAFLAGLVALVVPRVRHYAWLPLAATAMLYLLFSNGIVATALMSPLEHAYPPVQDARDHPDVSLIVVLTAYAADDADMSLSGKLNSSAAFRVLEAANLRAARPDAVVLVTGADTAARIMAEQLRRLGIPAEGLIVDAESPNTADSAAKAKELAGGRAMFLVTSGGHMRRAIGTFARQGLRVVPAPTDYWLPRDPLDASWTPSSLHLRASDHAVHEYLALAWYRLSGKI
jgi:uncharacterized SAM-binding protein YcdF (DUF218 family)